MLKAKYDSAPKTKKNGDRAGMRGGKPAPGYSRKGTVHCQGGSLIVLLIMKVIIKSALILYYVETSGKE